MIDVLIVDDHQAVRDSLESLLTDTGKIRIVASADGCVSCMQNLYDGHIPDLILLDMNMPDHNGIETLKCIKSVEEYASIPILFLTTFPEPLLLDEGLKLGAVGWILKSSGLNELVERIENSCDKSSDSENYSY